jgi:hypothetical protein
VLIMASSVVLKVIGSINFLMSFVKWAYNVDAHPVRLLGWVLGMLVFLGSVIYGLL